MPTSRTVRAAQIVRVYFSTAAAIFSSVLGGHRQQQLLDEVGDLGQPDVELAALLHLGLELLDPLLELVEPVAGDGAHHPIDDAVLEPAPLPTRRHVRHSATNRTVGRSVSVNSRGADVTST